MGPKRTIIGHVRYRYGGSKVKYGAVGTNMRSAGRERVCRESGASVRPLTPVGKVGGLNITGDTFFLGRPPMEKCCRAFFSAPKSTECMSARVAPNSAIALWPKC